MKKLIVALCLFIFPVLLLLAARYGSPDGAWDAAMQLHGTDAGDVYGMVVGTALIFLQCIYNFIESCFDYLSERKSRMSVNDPAEPVK